MADRIEHVQQGVNAEAVCRYVNWLQHAPLVTFPPEFYMALIMADVYSRHTIGSELRQLCAFFRRLFFPAGIVNVNSKQYYQQEQRDIQ